MILGWFCSLIWIGDEKVLIKNAPIFWKIIDERKEENFESNQKSQVLYNIFCSVEKKKKVGLEMPYTKQNFNKKKTNSQTIRSTKVYTINDAVFLKGFFRI